MIGTTMRSLAVAAVIAAVSVSCSSTGTTGGMRMYQAPEDRVWAAAIRAVQDLGADIRTMDRSAGIILARMPFEVMGTAVNLSISVRSSGATDRTPSGADVRIRASEVGRDTSDPERLQDLRDLEERYLDLVGAGAVGSSRRGVPIRPD